MRDLTLGYLKNQRTLLKYQPLNSATEVLPQPIKNGYFMAPLLAYRPFMQRSLDTSNRSMPFHIKYLISYPRFKHQQPIKMIIYSHYALSLSKVFHDYFMLVCNDYYVCMHCVQVYYNI